MKEPKKTPGTRTPLILAGVFAGTALVSGLVSHLLFAPIKARPASSPAATVISASAPVKTADIAPDETISPTVSTDDGIWG